MSKNEFWSFYCPKRVFLYNRGMRKKVLENKEQKKSKLLEAAFYLFSHKDIQDVTVKDLVDQAGIAKGTFYLYFKDKFDLRDYLISLESNKILMNALKEFEKNDIRSFEDSIVFMINQVLSQLESNPLILTFIKRNLSLGIFHDHLQHSYDADTISLQKMFAENARKAGYNYEHPDVVLDIIIEMVGSICYSSITRSIPLPIDELKPFLFNAVRGILEAERQPEKQIS